MHPPPLPLPHLPRRRHYRDDLHQPPSPLAARMLMTSRRRRRRERRCDVINVHSLRRRTNSRKSSPLRFFFAAGRAIKAVQLWSARHESWTRQNLHPVTRRGDRISSHQPIGRRPPPNASPPLSPRFLFLSYDHGHNRQRRRPRARANKLRRHPERLFVIPLFIRPAYSTVGGSTDLFRRLQLTICRLYPVK